MCVVNLLIFPGRIHKGPIEIARFGERTEQHNLGETRPFSSKFSSLAALAMGLIEKLTDKLGRAPYEHELAAARAKKAAKKAARGGESKRAAAFKKRIASDASAGRGRGRGRGGGSRGRGRGS